MRIPVELPDWNKRQLLFDNFLRIRKNLSPRGRQHRYLVRAKFWQRSRANHGWFCRQNQPRRVIIRFSAKLYPSQNTDLFVSYSRTRERSENNQNAQPRSQSSTAISDVTSPVKLVGKIRLGRLANNGKSKMAAPSQECDFSQNSWRNEKKRRE